jgi:chlorite dismutase
MGLLATGPAVVTSLGAGPGALGPTTGVGVLHLFCRPQVACDPKALLAAEERARQQGNEVVSAAILGHKADLCLMALGPELWSLRSFQSEVTAAGLELVSSYVSLTEVSEYAEGIPDQLKNARLYPKLPPEGKPAFCFYPMSKRRAVGENWYALDFEERRALMMSHGAVGRTFAGRVLQVVTGSTGLDDWEWGVTLFGVHPDDIKECVYQMRFDHASTRYAEFGPFYFGMVADLADVLARTVG